MARLVAAAAGFLVLFLASAADAHKLKVFAAAVGPRIEGTVYFVGGGPARGALVTIETPDHSPISQTKTDDEGRFTITAARRIDHVIVVNAGDGHSSRFTLLARDLPELLPAGADTAVARASEANPSAASTVSPASLPASLRDLVSEAVAQQILPLREEITASEDQIRIRDVLGGFGYILGLSGLALWLQARRVQRREQ
jgi:nickel transport protein